MSTRTFTRDQLEAIGVPFECYDEADAVPEFATELHREQVDTRRWVSAHELIFRAPDDGKAYRVTYVQGLTEHQDGIDPFEYGGATIEAVEVEQRTRTVEITEWHPVTKQAEPAAAEQPPAATPPVDVLERALRTLLADLDYDLHKATEHGEEDGLDHYPELAAQFAATLAEEAGR
jgi:hypothetical protein